MSLRPPLARHSASESELPGEPSNTTICSTSGRLAADLGELRVLLAVLAEHEPCAGSRASMYAISGAELVGYTGTDTAPIEASA